MQINKTMRLTSIAFSFIVPVCNEEMILIEQVTALETLLFKMNCIADQFEIILIENGSTDNTWNICQQLEKKFSNLRSLQINTKSYGRAIKHGFLSAKGEKIVLLNADFISPQFITDIVNFKYPEKIIIVASKTKVQSSDVRPLYRSLITRMYSLLINALFRVSISDTHGLKVFTNNKEFIDTLYACHSVHELFDTELIIRLLKRSWKAYEIPTKIQEMRPSRYVLSRRILNIFIDLSRLSCGRLFKHGRLLATHITADDFGFTAGGNTAIMNVFEAHNCDIISILPNFIAPQSSVWLRTSAHPAICLHFNLVRGEPILSSKIIPTLVTRTGQFHSLPSFLLRLFFGMIKTSEIELELSVQYSKLLDMGLQPRFIDSEQHVHTYDPVAAVVYKFAERNSLTIRSTDSTRKTLSVRLIKYMLFSATQIAFKYRYSGEMKKQSMYYHSIIIHPGSCYD
jgi:predicted glycoside hydrolase/deacetylase ChbG (UPF0249 family)/glycosyltransferase involved in cell wall biosynthesis